MGITKVEKYDGKRKCFFRNENLNAQFQFVKAKKHYLKIKPTVMTRLNIALDQSTFFGKNMFNFLVGMNYITENEADVAYIDEQTDEGRKIVRFGCY